MQRFTRKHIVVLTIAVMSIAVGAVWAQSGRGTMSGWVSFEGVGRNDLVKQDLYAHIELYSAERQGGPAFSTDTDEIGSYRIEKVTAGNYTLRISAPGYQPYEIEILIPSDFETRLATRLKIE